MKVPGGADDAAAPAPSARQAQWALLAGNFAIGCGVMAVAGTLHDLAQSLSVSVPVGGQLISVAAAVMAVGAPLSAALVGAVDRRHLLTLALVWYAAGHLLCALAPSYAALLPLRALTVIAAAVFTPQAAAAVGTLVPAPQRGGAITFVFLGWSLASVVGMPLSAWIGETYGWRLAFAWVGALSAVAALWVWRALPRGIRLPALSLDSWRGIFTHPALMAIVGVTALSAAGQFTLFSYLSPFLRQELGASPATVSALFLWFGLFGLFGNVWVSKRIDRIGPPRAVTLAIGAMVLSLLAWPLGTSAYLLAAVMVPWALGCFSSNSAQQARLALSAPAWAPGLISLNTSAMYLGQAIGAAGGGALVAASGYDSLHAFGAAWLLGALLLSLWAARRGGAARV